MEAIRAAVGDPKLTYLGYSYGTLLGAVYAHLYPAMIRAMVLDGAVDPLQGPVAAAEGQAVGFERAFNNFAAWCASAGADCPIGPDARKTVTTLLDDARQKPVAQNGRKATAGWVLLAVVASLYQRLDWPVLAQALADLGNGDAQGVFRIADQYYERDPNGHYSNLIDANSAINCADSTTTSSVDQIRQLQNTWRTKYPLFGPSMALGLLTCTFWSTGRDPYHAGAATGSPPLVVIGTKGDPATPYEQTMALANLLGTGQVLTWEGDGHTAYPDTPCITDAVNRYFIDLVPPAPGTSCPAA
jgi:pimeloyl-ACP methyl ester carboxylesterase